MTRITLGAGAALLLSTALAQAGALDRTGQPVIALFEEGRYAELSFGYTMPSVEGTFTSPLTGASSSGNVGKDFTTVVLSYKQDITDALSFAVIIEEPFGADVDYDDADPAYPIGGSEATFETLGVTVLGRYEFGQGFSVHGGARQVTVDADLFVRSLDATPGSPTFGQFQFYDADFGRDTDTAFVAGAAFERPDIALRVALTYTSETEFSNDTDFTFGLDTGAGLVTAGGGEGDTEFTLPQSVNLDLQTGIAEGTLLFGQVRWADWSETEINVPGYPFNPVVDYDGDYFTYTLGVGRQLTDRLAGAISVIYEPGVEGDFDPADPANTGGSNLSPYDGQLAVLLGATYNVTDSLEVGGGIRYARLGDVTTERIGAEFEGNDSLSLGLRVGYRF